MHHEYYANNTDRRKVGETETAKLEVHFIGNPKPEIIWTKDGEELVNSRHVQIRERENKTILQLINVNPSMAGEYRLVVVSFVWKLWGKY